MTDLSTLEIAMDLIDRPGNFCCKGVAPSISPGLKVSGVGPIAFPLLEAQATELKARCTQAGYGKGTQTIVDTEVRRVWHLSPNEFELTNPAWQGVVEDVVNDVQNQLGLGDRKLKPHLYDLLLYEKGGLFLSHRDGEKEDGMVATLVIVLPSAFSGGELIVRHEGVEKVIDFSTNLPEFHTQFASFYADCEHEVKPLLSGYRLCLIYNLTVAKSSSTVRAPRREEHVARVAEILKKWAEDGGIPPKVAYTLEHQYSENGLRWDTLKGVDLSRAEILHAAAMTAQCDAYLALVTLWETGAGEEDYDGRRGRRRSSDDDSGESGEYIMQEVFDGSLTASNWRSPDGGQPRFGEIPLEEEEIVPEDSLRAVTPKEEFEGFTGNAGMTLDRWYHRAAIVIWPKSRMVDVLVSAGMEHASRALVHVVSTVKRAGGNGNETQQVAIRLALRILTEWPVPQMEYRNWGYSVRQDVSRFGMAIVELGEEKLARLFIRNVLAHDGNDPGKSLVRMLSRFGWMTLQPEISAVFAHAAGSSFERDVAMLYRICAGSLQLGATEDVKTVCRVVSASLVQSLPQIDAKHPPRDAKPIRRFVKALTVVGDEMLLAKLITRMVSEPKKYPLHSIQIPALAHALQWAATRRIPRLNGLTDWLTHCRSELKSLIATMPTAPINFRRSAETDCKCGDCAELRQFLLDPKEHEHCFKMAQHRRFHLEERVTKQRLDVDCRTDTRPRPQVLICTKNEASYQRSLSEYHANVALLKHLKSFE